MMAKQTFTTGQVLTAAQMTSLQQTAMLGGDASAKVASYVLVAADAGTAISMSNGSATTITVNTGLFAAGDIVTIINLGAGVCTITAGTATVTTSGSLALAQNQGGVLRFTSASAAIFFQFATPASGDIEGVTAGTGISGGGTSGTVTITNSMATEITAKGDLIVGTGNATFDNLPVGTNGYTLVADSSVSPTGLKWAAPAGSGAMTFITGATLTAASTWNFPNNTFTSTYRNYLVVMEGRDSANNDAIYWHFRAGGTNNASNNVKFAVQGRVFDGTTFGQNSTGTTYFLAGYPNPSGGAWTVSIYAPEVATYTQASGSSSGTSGGTIEGATTNFAAFVNATTQYDAMGFTMSGNSFTGTYRVYGLADA